MPPSGLDFISSALTSLPQTGHVWFMPNFENWVPAKSDGTGCEQVRSMIDWSLKTPYEIH